MAWQEIFLIAARFLQLPYDSTTWIMEEPPTDHFRNKGFETLESSQYNHAQYTKYRSPFSTILELEPEEQGSLMVVWAGARSSPTFRYSKKLTNKWVHNIYGPDNNLRLTIFDSSLESIGKHQGMALHKWRSSRNEGWTKSSKYDSCIILVLSTSGTRTACSEL